MSFEGLNNFNRTFEREVSRTPKRDCVELVSGFLKTHLQPIAASHQNMNRRPCVAQFSVDQTRRSHAGAASQRLVFYTTFVGSNGYFSSFEFLDKICVGPPWLKGLMIPDLCSPWLDWRRFEVVHK